MKLIKNKAYLFTELFLLLVLTVCILYQRQSDESVYTFLPQENNYLKYVEFNPTYDALDKAYQYDVETYEGEVHLDWIELLSYLGAKYGGDFSKYRSADLDEVAALLTTGDQTMDEIGKDLTHYDYYLEAYSAVLDNMVGEYEVSRSADAESNAGTEDGGTVWETVYGLKSFSPIAKNFPYSDYDDFGASRSYGYQRNHLGHDMMGQTGTPIIAIESGYVEALGWNQYGGWRIGIRSFDSKRYYYYAHLRQNFPYQLDLKEGDIVCAGDVIGYMGRTGYSTTENTNNIETPHLHYGIQLIFDESQKEGDNEIWINCYALTKFLYKNRSEAVRNDETKEWNRIYEIKDPIIPEDFIPPSSAE